MLSIVLLMLMVTTMSAQREDAVWARNVAGATITMDGVLDEAVWAQAESLKVWYVLPEGGPTGLPTSGSRSEFQPEAITDPTDATVKFLVDGEWLWIGFYIPDSSIGGTQDWARWDGLLMSFKDHSVSDRPTAPREYFYTWWYADVDSLIAPGTPPMFRGYKEVTNDTARTTAQKARWDGRTHVEGISNDDSQPDEYWSVELKINLDSLGYDVTKPNGEIVEYNFSIWDQDWVWSGDPLKVSASRSWWQSPWNGNADNVIRVMIRSDVTVNSGAAPDLVPDVVLKNGAGLAAPVIDGVLDDEVWAHADSFDIRWGDDALRDSYPGVGPYRSGQFQPELGGNPRPPVVDPADATIKYFFRDDHLYLAAHVRDKLVQGNPNYDEWDGVRFIIGDREKLDGDFRMLFQQITVIFDAGGNVIANEFLPEMVDSSDTEWGATLKGNTTVNNHTDIDEGYYIELKLDLTYLGYPSGLGDHLLFMGVMLADGDSFDDPLSNYGTRTWWFREHNNGPAAAWMYMDPNLSVGIDDKPVATLPNTIELLGNYPNPFNPNTTIRYTIPFAGDVELSVFNVLGEQVTRILIPKQAAGTNEITFDAQNLTSGIYFYKVKVNSAATGKSLGSNAAKMVLIR
jgi:hypothetical protein